MLSIEIITAEKAMKAIEDVIVYHLTHQKNH